MTIRAELCVSLPTTLREFQALCEKGCPGHFFDAAFCSGAYRELDLLLQWLSSFSENATKRAYEKEVHRFYCWTFFVCRKLVAEIGASDLDSYENFVRNPPKSWCGTRNRRRAAGLWRPFEGALSETSCRFAFRVLDSLFAFLADFSKIQRNPFRVWFRVRKSSSMERRKPSPSLSFSSFSLLIKILNAECERFSRDQPERAATERMLFVIDFMGNTGVRGEELACIRLSDLFVYRSPVSSDDKWLFSLTNICGEKYRRIVLNASAKLAVLRYLLARGLPFPPPPSAAPLVSRLCNAEPLIPLGKDSIYGIVKDGLDLVASKIEQEHPDEADQFRKASPHWLRVTFHRMEEMFGSKLM